MHHSVLLRRFWALLIALLAVIALGAVSAPKASAHVGPAYPERWGQDFGQVSLCVNNRSSFAMQTATDYWNQTTNLNLVYQPGPYGCILYPENRKIQIYDGLNDTGCVYFSIQAIGNYYSNVNVYMSTHPSRANCFDAQIERNHFASKGMGVALGLQVFDNTSTDVHVMNKGSVHSVSWPQPADRYTWWYRNYVG